jgi:hypothetical protein
MKSFTKCGLCGIILSAAFLTGGGCDGKAEQSNKALTLGAQIAKSATAHPTAPLNVAELTDFQWDRLYIFAPFASHDDIQESLGFAWPNVSKTHIHHSDVNTLLVFVKDKQVAGWIEYPRVKADFSLVSSMTGYAPKDATFNIKTTKAWPAVAIARTPVLANGKAK